MFLTGIEDKWFKLKAKILFYGQLTLCVVCLIPSEYYFLSRYQNKKIKLSHRTEVIISAIPAFTLSSRLAYALYKINKDSEN